MRDYHIKHSTIKTKLNQLACHGRTPDGGVTRLAFTPQDKAARQLVQEWMRDLDMQIRRDAAGNIIGRWGPASGPAVAMGSHLDSVPNGGIYDGSLGVVSALAVVEGLQAHGVCPELAVEVIVFSDEEGARFGGGLFGSKAMVGNLEEDILKRRDAAGITLKQAMLDFGLEPNDLEQAQRQPAELKAYIELHIEQGAVLESRNLPVGIVKAIAGPYHLEASIRGRSDHAGATPMYLRRDALLGAAEAVVAAERIACAAGPTTVATVGQVHVLPNAVNVIPGQVTMSFDVRDIDVKARQQAVAEIKRTLDEIGIKRNLEVSTRTLLAVPPVELCPRLVRLCERLAVNSGIPALTMVSGAAHDAMNLTELTDVAMVFVRSKQGLSHCPEEYSSPEDIQVAAELMYLLVKELILEASN